MKFDFGETVPWKYNPDLEGEDRIRNVKKGNTKR